MRDFGNPADLSPVQDRQAITAYTGNNIVVGLFIF